MHKLRPFVGYGRATLTESPVDEIVRPSGLAVPLEYDGDNGVKRGVILHVVIDPTVGGDWILAPGMVVHYRRGVDIAGTVIVDLTDILAYEADE